MGKLSTESMCCTPAMFARYLMVPSLAACRTAFSRSSSLVRSVLMKTISPPISLIISQVLSPSSALMSNPTVIKLLAAAATAVARPIPVPAPVTTHTFLLLKFSSCRKRISSRVIFGSWVSTGFVVTMAFLLYRQICS